MSKSIRLGMRPSPLAFKQVEEIKSRLPHIHFDLVAIETRGDRDKRTPLSGLESSDFFTYDIEIALLEGRIDVAVHSAKDLEDKMPDELFIVALTDSISPYESLISKEDFKLAELPPGAAIGTSSRKRKAAVLNFRNDLVVKDIRGNIDERLRQLGNGDFDAIVVAYAAMLRLGYKDRVTEIIPPHIIEAHPMQGRLAVQVRCDRKDMIEIFEEIDER